MLTANIKHTNRFTVECWVAKTKFLNKVRITKVLKAVNSHYCRIYGDQKRIQNLVFSICSIKLIQNQMAVNLAGWTGWLGEYGQNIARIAKRCPSKISSVVNMLQLFLLKLFTIYTVKFCHNLSLSFITIGVNTGNNDYCHYYYRHY